MSMKPFQTLDRLRSRMAEALIAQSGIRDPALAHHLRGVFCSPDANRGGLIRSAVLEGAFPYETGGSSLASLSGTLLNPSTVEALNGDGSGEGYSFPLDRKPYLHQLKAWEILGSERARSAVITSGTGSGKTECFLVPLLDDLMKRDQVADGVEAIMLYPLNALIASQQERLDAWTAPAGGRIRYCLYNGDLPEKLSSREQRDAISRNPQVVPDRHTLRSSPPPLVVTNLTMLEYMLVRPKDTPIIAASKGRLKWIVLDEAHTLIGAAAAEVALLLRRVMEAFEVDPANVRFIATSATIGEGDEVRERIRRFLADVGGISLESVDVIEGGRVLPTRPGCGGTPPSPAELATLDPGALYDRLGSFDPVWELLENLRRPLPLRRFDDVASMLNTDGETLATALTRARSASGEFLAPLRVHAFHRAVPGLWCCTNPNCIDSLENWPRGRILHEREDMCPSCTMPVAEVFSCNVCGEAFMRAEEVGNRLVPPRRLPPIDEFEFDAGRESDPDEEDADWSAGEVTEEHCFAIGENAGYAIFVDRNTGETRDSGSDQTYRLNSLGDGHGSCPSCQASAKGDKLYPFRFGAPFVVGNAAPVLLASMPPSAQPRALPQMPPIKPSDGRQLISFTDSRQGTARMAAKLQIASERAFIRSFVYQSVQHVQAHVGNGQAESEIANIKEQMPNWRDVPYLRNKVEELQREASPKGGVGVGWGKLRDELAERVEVREWLAEVWGERVRIFHHDTETAGTALANALLLRELMRRPRAANSLETMGLVRLVSSSIEKLSEGNVPNGFLSRGGTLGDWKSWLYTILTFTIRGRSAVRVSREIMNWMVRDAIPLKLIPQSQEIEKGELRWPRVNLKGRQTQAVQILLNGLRIDADDRTQRAEVNDWLARAWDQLSEHFCANSSGERALDFPTLGVSALREGYLCPVTRRFVDVAPFGLTPYARTSADRAAPVEMPECPVDLNEEARLAWLASDERVAGLRERGLWTAIQDRISLFASYARSAEHSAQLEPFRLRSYENAFKAGHINLLNCSTTMEMGVDIGSVNGVMMTNVPPSIANYRQRVGRAGRRGQPISLAFTFAKDRPLDREAFRDPDQYLNRVVAAPHVALDSRPIVQRHLNAFLLGKFLAVHSGNAMTAQIGDFMGCPFAPDAQRPLVVERPVKLFLEWLGRGETVQLTKASLSRLARGSILANRADLVQKCASAIAEVEEEFTREWSALREQLKGADVTGASAAITIQLKRLCGEFLLGEFADRGFLPGHGFPNHVVAFELDRVLDVSGSPEGSRGRRHGGPKRPLDIAIRDYAPGSETVVDGQVFRVGGVTLNWQRPSSEAGVREVQALRWSAQCLRCGDSWTGAGDSPKFCRSCGEASLDIDRYLKPAGFLRDRHRTVHADIETVDFVRAQPARVSAGGVNWEKLSRPELGRLRVNRNGTVYFHTRGPSGEGYGLCLRCGRMEPMNMDEEVCSALFDHKPLRARESFLNPCEGNAQLYAIQHGLTLGHEIRTDVFELQSAISPSPGAANAIAIALREAIAGHLGIEATEMGYGIAPTRNELGNQTLSVYLYDRPAGGAGYVTRAAEELRVILPAARRLLECPEGCRHSCSACILVSDAPEREEELDRFAAMEFIDECLTLPKALPVADYFVPDADISDRPLAEIDEWLQRTSGARLYLWTIPVDILALHEWPVTDYLRRWTDNGRRITLCLPGGTLQGLDDAQRLFLRDYSVRHDVEIAEATTPSFDNGANLFAYSISGARNSGWASRDSSLLAASKDWGGVHKTPIARGSCALDLINVAVINHNVLTPKPGAQVVPLGARLEGRIDDFGNRMADLLTRAIDKISDKGGNRPVRAVYCDRYARSPLVLRLLIDTVGRLANEDNIQLTIETAPDRQNQSCSRHLIWSDVEADSELRALVKHYGQRKGVNAELSVGRPPHKRTLTLLYADGNTLQVDLDQGFGWLVYKGRDNGFQPGSDSQAQAKRLDFAEGIVARREEMDSQMVIWRR